MKRFKHSILLLIGVLLILCGGCTVPDSREGENSEEERLVFSSIKEVDNLLGGEVLYTSTFTSAQRAVIWTNSKGEVFVSVITLNGVEGTVELDNAPSMKPAWINRYGF